MLSAPVRTHDILGLVWPGLPHAGLRQWRGLQFDSDGCPATFGWLDRWHPRLDFDEWGAGYIYIWVDVVRVGFSLVHVISIFIGGRGIGDVCHVGIRRNLGRRHQ